MSKHLGTLTLDLVANVGRYLEPLKKAERQTQKSTESMGQQFKVVAHASAEVETSLKRLEFSISSVLGYMSVSKVIEFADGYTQLNNKLKLVTQSEEQLQTALNDTFRIAQETASTWSGVNDVYSKFAQNQEKLGLTQKEVASITQTVTKAVGMSGASAAAADAALMQFGQALNTGVLRGAELNSVMSQTPALAKAIADGMGVSVGELKKLGEQGKITTEAIIESLKKVAPQIESEYAKTATTVSESFNRVSNEFTKLIGELDQSHGVSDKAVQGITLLAENIDKLAIIGGGAALVVAGRLTSSYIGAGVAAVQSAMQQRSSIIAVAQAEALSAEISATRASRLVHLTQVELANAQAELVRMAGMQRLAFIESTIVPLEKRLIELKNQNTIASTVNTNAINNLAAAQSRLNVVKTATLSLFGGTGGFIATLGIVVSSMLLFRKTTSETTQVLETQGKTVAQLTKEFEKLTDSQKRQAIQQQTQNIKKYTDELHEQKIALMEVIRETQRKNEVTGQDAVTLFEAQQEYKRGKITVEEYGRIISTLTFKTEEWKNKVNDQVVATSKATEQVNFANQVLNSYQSITGDATQRNDTFNNSLQDTANKAKQATGQLALLSDEAQRYLGTLNSADKLAYIKMNNTWSADKASFMFDARTRMGWDKTKPLTPELLQKLEQEYESQQQLRALTTPKPVKSNTVKSSSNKNNQNKNKSPDYQMMVYQAFRNNGLSDAQARAFTAEVGRENGYDAKYLFGGHIDASNKKQNLGIISWQGNRRTNLIQHLQQAGVMKNGKIEHTQEALNAQVAFALQEIVTNSAYAQTKNKFLSNPNVDYKTAYEVLGDNFIRWDRSGRAVLGVQGAKNHAKKRDDYYHQISAKLSASGDSSYMQTLEHQQKEEEKAKEQLHQDRQKFIYDNMSPVQKILHDKQKKIEHLATLNLDFETQFKPYLDEIERNAEIDIAIFERTQNNKLSRLKDFLKTEEQLLKDRHVEEIFQIQTDKELTQDQKTEALGLIKHRYNYELEKIKEVKQERIKQVGDMVLNLNDIMPNLIDLKAQRSMSPMEYQRWKMQNAFDDDTLQAHHKFNQVKDEINKKDERGFYKIDEKERHRLMQDAEREHQQALLDIREKYRILGKDLDQQEFEAKMQMYQNMLGQASQVWGSMTQMVKDSAGENSSAYKAMFLVQQGIAIAQAIMNTEIAATKALAEGGAILGPKMAMATRAMGYISVGLIASQTISGMAHSGIDNIPKEGTWLLDKGERVLSPRQNADLTQFLRQQNHSSTQPITINVVVNATQHSVSGTHTNEQKLLGESIANAVRAVIIQEQRQNGLLSRN